MKHVFSYDGFLVQTLKKLVDCLYMSVLWIIFSIPIITIGASTTALLNTVDKNLLHERGYIWSEFWTSFKQNFKQTTIAWFIAFLVILIGTTNFMVLQACFSESQIINIILYTYTMWFIIVWILYIFAYINTFNDNIKTIFSNTFRMMFGNILFSFLLFVVFIVAVLAALIFPVITPIIPALYACFVVFLTGKVFKKYIPSDETDIQEEVCDAIDG